MCFYKVTGFVCVHLYYCIGFVECEFLPLRKSLPSLFLMEAKISLNNAKSLLYLYFFHVFFSGKCIFEDLFICLKIYSCTKWEVLPTFVHTFNKGVNAMINYNFSLNVHSDIIVHEPVYSPKNNAESVRCLSLLCSQIDKKSNEETILDVNLVGMQKVDPISKTQVNCMNNSDWIISKSHASNEYAFIYVTKGCGDLYLKKCVHESVSIRAGMLCWIPVGQWYAFKPDKKDEWGVYYIHAKGSIIEQVIRHSPLDGQSVLLNIGFNEELIDLFKRADEIRHSTESSKYVYLAGITLHMIGLILVCAKSTTMSINSNEQKIEEAKAIMKENVMNNIDMNQLAISLQLSYSWFRKLFKKYCGISPSHYFMDLKIEKLKDLIVTSNMPINELMMQLNCGTIENFYKAFKKHTGYTPSEYRTFMVAQSGKHFVIEHVSDLVVNSKLG